MVTIEGNPWFVVVDILEALQTDRHQSQNFMRSLGDDEKLIAQKKYLGLFDSLFAGRIARVALISESGLYKVIMRSDKKVAKPFQDWVTKVVLPAIRKDGGYIMGEEKVVTGEMSEDELVLKAMTIMSSKVERL